MALHLASPRVAYTDKAKSALVLPNEVDEKLANAVQVVTKNWARTIKAEERDASAAERRRERLIRSRTEKQTDVAFEIMPRAYADASDNGELPANVRQIMYAARPEIQAAHRQATRRSVFHPDVAAELYGGVPRKRPPIGMSCLMTGATSRNRTPAT